MLDARLAAVNQDPSWCDDERNANAFRAGSGDCTAGDLLAWDQLARHQGVESSNDHPGGQPTSREEATAWTKWLLGQDFTVSIGLLQVNSEHAAPLHGTPEQVFDPCTNLRSAAASVADGCRK
jgi:hypothetical protein